MLDPKTNTAPVDQKLSPWAELIVKESLPLAPKDGSLQEKAEFLKMLANKLQAAKDFERMDPRTMESVVLKRGYKELHNYVVGKEHTCFRVHRDGRIVLGTDQGNLTIVQGAPSELSSTSLCGHGGAITRLEALPDGRIVSVGKDRALRVWTDKGNGDWNSEVLVGDDCFDVSYVRSLVDGRILSCEAVLFIWTRDEKGAWSGERLCADDHWACHTDVFPDGRIATCSNSAGKQNLLVWTKKGDGGWSYEELLGHTDYVNHVYVLSDCRVVSASLDHTVRVWTKGADEKWSSEVLFGHTYCTSLQALPDGRIVSANSDQTLRVWTRGRSGSWSYEKLAGHSGRVSCLQALPDGRILTGGNDGTLRLWSHTAKSFWFRTGWTSEVLRGHTACVSGIQALPDGRIVSLGADGTIRIWDGTPVDGGASC